MRLSDSIETFIKALLAEDDWSKSAEIDALIGTVREREAWTDAEE